MSFRHTNPQKPRWDEKQRREQWAHAPYNFVPLPEKVVQARQPLDQDVYEGYTGWIECELETCSPTYVRGMLTEEQYVEHGDTPPDKMTDEHKEERAPFFGLDDQLEEGKPKPIIPGSSLRGMLRALVEIAGYGKMRWVTDEERIFFRAVAASDSDPLKRLYEKALGKNGSKVRAGYLAKRGDEWWIHPAFTPAELDLPAKKDMYLKIGQDQVRHLTGYIPFNDVENYRPQLFSVSFNPRTEEKRDEEGKIKKYTIYDVVPYNKEWKYQGVLVCSGNMLETGKQDQESPRRRHALVLDVNRKAKPLQVAPQAVKDYLAGLTTFQREEFQEWGSSRAGVLEHNVPVFYVPPEVGAEVIYFGHSPNFRIPARVEHRATVPLDFVPLELRDETMTDLADVIFGWTPEPGGKRRDSRAGRVFLEDARMVSAKNGVWLKPEPITPHVLAQPKPTTFQHYLVQDKDKKHNPDDKKSLAHFSTPADETQIRGHKMYWHKGQWPDIEADSKEKEHPTQLTRIIPVKPGVKFICRVRFENLRMEELGALLWTLTLPGETGKTYRHRVGMGKPLGMGSVAISVVENKIHLHDRRDRYSRLFDDNGGWHPGIEMPPEDFIKAFEDFVVGQINASGKRLRELERIQMMLKLLEWPSDNPEPAWQEWTRYMEIEHDQNGNEYKERPVLPDPFYTIIDTPDALKKRPVR